MILLRFVSRRRPRSSDLLREVAEDEDFDETSVVYYGQYVGWRDAPTLPDQAAQQARDAIVDRIENEYGIKVEALSAEEKEEVCERYDSDTS